MKQNRKLKSKKRVKRKEAELMGFKLIINNQGQFITEIKNYPMDKVDLHFHKNNAGVITAMLRECKTNFTDLSEELEKIARDVTVGDKFYSIDGTEIEITSKVQDTSDTVYEICRLNTVGNYFLNNILIKIT